MAAANQALGSDDEEDYVAVCAALTIIYANLDGDDVEQQRRFTPISLDGKAALKQCKGNWPH